MIEDRKIQDLIDIVDRGTEYDRHCRQYEGFQDMRISLPLSGAVSPDLSFNPASEQPQNKEQE